MNMEQLKIQQSFFPSKHSKQNEVKKWLKDIEQFSQKSIYDLSWKSFYEELHKLGQRRFLHQYGFSYKGKLQQTIVKSGLSQKKLSLYDFILNRNQESGESFENKLKAPVILKHNFISISMASKIINFLL